MSNTEIYPTFVDQGKEYYNLTKSAEYAGYTMIGLRRKLQKLETEHGIVVPMVRRGGLAKCIDKRVLDHLRKPMFTGEECKWCDKMRWIILQIHEERR